MSLPEAAKSGSVAVVWDGKTAMIVEGCHLPSRFLDFEDHAHRGFYTPSERVLFRPDEVSAGCATATHVVGAFARWDNQLSAILVPLPCPSVASKEPARGCIGAGKTGAQRALLARKRNMTPPSSSAGVPDPAPGLEIWALVPDTLLGTRAINQGPMTALWEQGFWIFHSYDPRGIDDGAVSQPLPMRPDLAPAPSLRWVGSTLRGRPVFEGCFWPHIEVWYPHDVDP